MPPPLAAAALDLSGVAPTNTSDWPSGDNAIADAKGTCIGNGSVRAIWLAGDTPTSTRATGAGGPGRARLQTASAERAAASQDGERASKRPSPVQRPCRRLAGRDIDRSGARILDRDAQAGRVLPAAARVLVQTMPQQRAYSRWDGRRQETRVGFAANDEGQRVGGAVSLECDTCP